MDLARVRSWLLTACIAAILATGCGQGSAGLSPTGPTDVPNFDMVSNLDLAHSNASSTVDLIAQDNVSSAANHQAGGSFRELSGAVSARGTDSLTVRGTTVQIEHATLIRHGHRILTIADIQVGDHVEVRGITDGTTLIASEIKVEDRDDDDDDEDDDEDDDDDDDKAEIKGRISALSGTCPALSFTVAGTRVTTNGTTAFKGTPCDAVVNGARADVQGSRQTDGSIIAAKLDTKLGENEIDGAVSGLTGTCPNLTFSVGATRVTANSRTEFKGKGCRGIVNGAQVEAKGTLQPDGSIVAVKVDVDDDDEDDDDDDDEDDD